jgi:tetratricopeptide (TPR) repeat protein
MSFVAAILCAAQTVSVDQLLHRVPAGATREYRATLQSLNAGDLAESIRHCKKAIEADPDNGAAHNDLGVLYLNDGQLESALAEFRRAIVLQPKLALAHLNLAFAHLALGQPADAELAVRRCLALEPSNRRANLILGWSLAAEFHYTQEALDSLRIAARDYAEAHLAAADVLVHQGAIEAARKEVVAYLDTENAEQRSTAEAWLRFLTLN